MKELDFYKYRDESDLYDIEVSSNNNVVYY